MTNSFARSPKFKLEADDSAADKQEVVVSRADRPVLCECRRAAQGDVGKAALVGLVLR